MLGSRGCVVASYNVLGEGDLVLGSRGCVVASYNVLGEGDIVLGSGKLCFK